MECKMNEVDKMIVVGEEIKNECPCLCHEGHHVEQCDQEGNQEDNEQVMSCCGEPGVLKEDLQSFIIPDLSPKEEGFKNVQLPIVKKRFPNLVGMNRSERRRLEKQSRRKQR